MALTPLDQLNSPPQTGLIDYDKLEEKALEYRPKMIICGGSAYSREWDYKRFREIADKVRPQALLQALCLCANNLSFVQCAWRAHHLEYA